MFLWRISHTKVLRHGIFFSGLLCVVLLMGCEFNPPDTEEVFDTNLVGRWTDMSWGFGYMWDGYEITDTGRFISFANFGYGEEINFAGSIEYSIKTANVGVIIIKYEEDHRHHNWQSPFEPADNYYYAIYYRNLNKGVSVQLAEVGWGHEMATLEAAKNKFTLGNVGNYISHWGTYTK